MRRILAVALLIVVGAGSVVGAGVGMGAGVGVGAGFLARRSLGEGGSRLESLQPHTKPTAEALARSLQQRYDTVRDFSSAFVHTYRGGVLRKQASERGTMSVKKPGKMRWEYAAPEKKTFVSDGAKIYTYIPQDRQVIVSSVPAADEASTPALFLAGKGDIARDFTASYLEPAVQGLWTIQLAPRRKEKAYDTLVLTVDPATLQIRSLTTTDSQGGTSTFTFSNMKENQGLSDKEFAFRIPRGVDVITDGSVSR